MTTNEVGAGLAQLVGTVAVAPLAAGLIQHLKARMQGRPGPSVTQPYRELRRLWRKATVSPDGAGILYRAAPALVVACLMVAALVVPVGGQAFDWGVGHDAIVLVGLLALGRFAITVAAWDTGSGFALMGAGRDLTFAVFIEGTLLLVILLAALTAGGSTDLVAMSHAASGGAAWHEPMHWCAAVAFGMVAVAETGRQPVDNPDTHLELTMVHEGPLLEYAGRELACLQWAASARLWLMMILTAGLFLPSGGAFLVRLGIALIGVVVLCFGVAITETALAKMRILRVPVFLSAAAALCLIGLGSWLAAGGA